MTKDEAMKKMREALETIAVQDSGIPGSAARSDCMAAMALQALRATATIEAPTSEAVAEKPQADAVIPTWQEAATDLGYDIDAPQFHREPFKGEWGVSEFMQDEIDRLRAAIVEASASPVPRAQGGITNDDDQQISAQGIDHAKRAEVGGPICRFQRPE